MKEVNTKELYTRMCELADLYCHEYCGIVKDKIVEYEGEYEMFKKDADYLKALKKLLKC